MLGMKVATVVPLVVVISLVSMEVAGNQLLDPVDPDPTNSPHALRPPEKTHLAFPLTTKLEKTLNYPVNLHNFNYFLKKERMVRGAIYLS